MKCDFSEQANAYSPIYEAIRFAICCNWPNFSAHCNIYSQFIPKKSNSRLEKTSRIEGSNFSPEGKI